MNTKVDAYIANQDKWTKELETIRGVLLETELSESFKWNAPVYTLENKNVVGISAFKNHYGIWFFNGVFLKDKHNLLVNAQESTKAMRQIRFEKNTTIEWAVIQEYILEAIENKKKGLKINPSTSKTYEIPESLQSAFNSNRKLIAAFKLLSFGKQKEYANYISEAKREKTKVSRIEKIAPMIIQGEGLNDKYRNC